MKHLFSICLALSAGLCLPADLQARGPLGPPALIEADHLMGKWEKPPGKPVLDPKLAARAEELYGRAQARLAEGDYEAAETLLLQAKKNNPDHLGVLKARTRTLLTLGYLDWNEEQALAARVDIQRARRLRPQDQSLLELERLTESLVARIQRLKPSKTSAK